MLFVHGFIHLWTRMPCPYGCMDSPRSCCLARYGLIRSFGYEYPPALGSSPHPLYALPAFLAMGGANEGDAGYQMVTEGSTNLVPEGAHTAEATAAAAAAGATGGHTTGAGVTNVDMTSEGTAIRKLRNCAKAATRIWDRLPTLRRTANTFTSKTMRRDRWARRRSCPQPEGRLRAGTEGQHTRPFVGVSPRLRRLARPHRNGQPLRPVYVNGVLYGATTASCRNGSYRLRTEMPFLA